MFSLNKARAFGLPLLALAFVLPASSAYADCAQVTVGVNTIQSAVDAVPNPMTGDYCIQVGPGTYQEQVTVQGIDTGGFLLTLESQGSQPAILSPPTSSTAAFVLTNASVTLSGFAITPANVESFGILISSPDVLVSGIDLEDAGSEIQTAGIELWGAAASQTTISGSTIVVSNASADAFYALSSSNDSILNTTLASTGGGDGAYFSGGSLEYVYQSSVTSVDAEDAALYLADVYGSTISASAIQDLGPGGCASGSGSGNGLVFDGSNANTLDFSTVTTNGSYWAAAWLTNGSSYNSMNGDVIQENTASDAMNIGTGASFNAVAQSSFSGNSSVWCYDGGLVEIAGLSNTVQGAFISDPDTLYPGNAAGVLFDPTAGFNQVNASTITTVQAAYASVYLNAASSNDVTTSYIADTGGSSAYYLNGEGASSGDTLSSSTLLTFGNEVPTAVVDNASGTFMTNLFLLNPSAGDGLAIQDGASFTTLALSTVTTQSAVDAAVYINASSSNTITQSWISDPGGYNNNVNGSGDGVRMESAYDNTLSLSTVATQGANDGALTLYGASSNTITQSALEDAGPGYCANSGASANAAGALLSGSGGNLFSSATITAQGSSDGAFLLLSGNLNQITDSVLMDGDTGAGATLAGSFNSISASIIAADSSWACGSAALNVSASSNTVSGSSILDPGTLYPGNANGVYFGPSSSGNTVSGSAILTTQAAAAAAYFDGSFDTLTQSNVSDSGGGNAVEFDTDARFETVSASTITADGAHSAAVFFNGASSDTVTASAVQDFGGTGNGGSGDGVRLDGGSGNSVGQDNILTSGAADAALLVYGSSSNLLYGLYATDYGGSLVLKFTDSAQNNLLSSSTFVGAGSGALYADSAAGTTVTGSFLSDLDGGDAVELDGATGFTVNLSTITTAAARDAAFFMTGAAQSNAVNSCYIADPQGSAALELDGAVLNSIAGSTIVSNAAYGAYLNAASSNTLSGNLVEGTPAAFVSLGAGNDLIGNSFVSLAAGSSALELATEGVYLGSNLLDAGSQGGGVLLEAGSGGVLNFTSNTVTGGAQGVFIATTTAGLDISSMTFRSLAAGATAFAFGGGSTASTFTFVDFADTTTAINVDASKLNAGSTLLLANSIGARTGHLFSDDPLSLVTFGHLTAPGPTLNLTYQPRGVSAIGWSWNTSTGATGYDFYLSSSAAPVLVSTTTYVSPGLEQNTAYTAQVAASNYGVLGPLTPLATGYTTAAVPQAFAPLSVGYSSITVAWNENGNPAYTQYQAQIWAAAGSTTTLTLTGNTTTFSGLASATTYFLQVRGRNLANIFTAPVQISTMTLVQPPPAPTGLIGVTVGLSSIAWSWNAVANASGYQFYPLGGGGPITLATTVYVSTGLAQNAASAAQVGATVSGVAGLLSPAATGYTAAAPPAGLGFSAVLPNAITLQWNPNGNPGYTSYEADLWSAGSSTTSLTLMGDATTFSSLAAGATYFLRVRAVGLSGAFSPAVQISTITPLCAYVAAGFATIQSAVNALPTALTRDFCIKVGPGTYGEQVTIQGVNTAGFRLTLLSDGNSAAVLAPPASSTAAFVVSNASVTLEGFAVAPPNSVDFGVLITSPNVTVDHLNLRDPGGNIQDYGIDLFGAGSSGATLSNSMIAVNGGSAYALYATESSNDAILYSGLANEAAQGNGTSFNQSSFETITQSSFTTFDSFTAALQLYAVTDSTVTASFMQDLGPGGCSSGSNNAYGIDLSGASRTLLSFSTVASNGGFASLQLEGGTQGDMILGDSIANSAYGRAVSIDFTSDFNSIFGSTVTGVSAFSCTGSLVDIGGATNTISGSVFSDLNGLGAGAGAVYFDQGSAFNTVQTSTINTVGSGFGAVFIYDASSNAVTGNYIADDNGAGAVTVYSDGAAAAASNVISSDTVEEYGGGNPSITLTAAASTALRGLTVEQPSGGDGLYFTAGLGNNVTYSTITTRDANDAALYWFQEQGDSAASCYAADTAESSAMELNACGLCAVTKSTLFSQAGATAFVGAGSSDTLTSDTFNANAGQLGLYVQSGNGLILSSDTFTGASVGLQLQSPVPGLAVSTLTFQSLSAGATAIQFLSGLWDSTFTYVDFADTTLATNVDASGVGAGSWLMFLNPSGPRAGTQYDDDPGQAVVHFLTLATPPAPTGLAGAALGTSSITWTWSTVANTTGYDFYFSTGGSFALATASFTQTGLGVNKPYGAQVQSIDLGLTSPLTALVTAYTLAAIPASFTKVSADSTAIVVTWSPDGNPVNTTYIVNYSTTAGVFSSSFTVTGSSTASLTGLTASTSYYLEVKAENGAGVFTGESSSLFVPTAPNAPSGLLGAALGVSSISWTWNTVPSAVSYNFYEVGGATVTGLSGPPYIETGLTPAGAYSAQITAVNGTGESSRSSAESDFTLAAAPTALSSTSVNSVSIGLSWSGNGNAAAASYEVDYSSQPGVFTTQLSAAAGITTATLSGLTASTTYYIEVRAQNGNGVFSSASPPITVPTAPSAPTGLTATVLGVSSISWTWNTVASAASYNFYEVGGATVAGLGGPPYIETGLTPAGAYAAAVTAVNASGESSLSSAATAYTLAAAPTLLSSTSVNSVSIGLAWNADGNAPAASYEVDYSATAGVFTTHRGVAAGVTTATLSGLTSSTTYFIEVRAENGAGLYSAPSAAITVPTAPEPPTGLSGAALGVASITWTWSPVNGAASYDFYFSTGGYPVSLSTTTLTEIGLSTNTAYAAAVTARDAAGESSLSATVTTYTLAARPTAFTLGSVFITSAAFSWGADENPNGTQFRVTAVPLIGGAPTAATATGTTLTMTGLSGGTTYTVTLAALNGAGIYSLFGSTLTVVTQAVTEAVATISSTGTTIVDFNPSQGPVVITVPPGAFASPLVMTVTAPGGYPIAGSPDASLTGTGVGIEILLSQLGAQPQQPVTLSISYAGANLGHFNPNELVIARYDPTDGVWVPLASTPDPANDRVIAVTSHFSMFQIMEAAAVTTVSDPKVFPNPFRPALGHTSITFSNLPPETTLKIYTLIGEKVRELETNASGIASWDARNADGEHVASGVYFVEVEGPGGKDILKVIIQR